MFLYPTPANVNIAELQKLIKESRIVKQMKHKAAVKPVVNLPPLSEDEMRMLSDDPMIVQVYPEAEQMVLRDQVRYEDLFYCEGV